MTLHARPKVLHFISNAAHSTYFCAIADHRTRDKFEVAVATLSPAGALQADMELRGIRTFWLGELAGSQHWSSFHDTVQKTVDAIAARKLLDWAN